MFIVSFLHVNKKRNRACHHALESQCYFWWSSNLAWTVILEAMLHYSEAKAVFEMTQSTGTPNYAGVGLKPCHEVWIEAVMSCSS